VSFFGAHGHLPLGIALLLAAILGVLLVVIPGTGRIVQLRMMVWRHRTIDADATAGTQPVRATSGTRRTWYASRTGATLTASVCRP
jgi:hypothetical protein